jgi:ATP-dependent exoDNAse (exonuclease V) alpha subunit
MTNNITLTQGQEDALASIVSFLQSPTEIAFKLTGHSGTGKSTLVRTFLDRLPSYMKTLKLLNPQMAEYEVQLTATTNKAAESFSHLTGMDVITIHSFLGLRVETNTVTWKKKLIAKSTEKKSGYILLIDEYSYVDSALLDYIFKLTEHCKIIFIGDPAQLKPVMSAGVPVGDAKFPEVCLTEVVRQAKNDKGEPHPISVMAEQCRNAVNTGDFPVIKVDGEYIIHLPRDKFNKAIEDEFTRLDWRYQDSKILAWTNACTIGFNKQVSQIAKGNPSFQVGDYAVCNSFLNINKVSFKTDQLVMISTISGTQQKYGVTGKYFGLDHRASVFVPDSLSEKNAFIKHARSISAYSQAEEADSQWGDLRAAFSCTINKSQGSTFDRVFIDLDDVARCNNRDDLARMLYVGPSRARHQVFFTGDLV